MAICESCGKEEATRVFECSLHRHQVCVKCENGLMLKVIGQAIMDGTELKSPLILDDQRH